MDELINKLYDICKINSKEELSKNKELFQQFYYQFRGIYNLDEKVYLIFKTIIINSYLINTEYCISEIIDFIKNHQERICWQNSQKKDTNIDDVNNMLRELAEYKNILDIVTSPNFNSLNSINHGSIGAYNNSEIFIYYTDALTRILSTNYLLFSKEKCDEIMNLIYDSEWLNKIIKGIQKNSMLDRDLIYKYISRILPIKEFLSTEKISEDILIKAIIGNKIKDKKMILTLIKELSPIKILNIFDDKIENLLDFILNLNYIGDVDKLTLLNIIIEKCMTEDYYQIILEILESKYANNELVLLALEGKKEKVILHAKDDYLEYEEDIEYLLNQGITDVNFISNIMHLNNEKRKKQLVEKGLVREEYFGIVINEEDSEMVKKDKMVVYNITGRIIDYNLAIALLKKYFNKEMVIGMEEMKAIVRSIITKELKDKGMDYNVVFIESESIYGKCDNINNIIVINNGLLRNFLAKENIEKKDFHLFITMFHEMRHAIQSNNMKKNIYDYNTYIMLKEEIISKYDSQYYESNYKKYLKEIDAREGGLKDSLEFFNRTIPFVVPIMQQIHDRELEKYEYVDYNRKKFTITKKKEIIDIIFDRIVAQHPEILKEYPILELEYCKDGTLREYKDIEQLSSYNQDIVRNILKNKFLNDEELVFYNKK